MLLFFSLLFSSSLPSVSCQAVLESHQLMLLLRWMLHSINAFIGSHLLLKLLLLTVIVKCDSTKNQCNSYYYGHQSDHDFLLHNSRPFLILISILFAFISQSPCERHSPYNIFLSYNIRTFLSINSDGFQPVSDHIS